jgi:SAM-dependent methyltransferase
VALLLGDAYHPGGAVLTRRLADRLDLRPGGTVLDVASGRGGTALLLASEYGVAVHGVDLSAANVAAANAAAASVGAAPPVIFTSGDAERLPYPDALFDAVMCECALCTFPDKPAAATEMARVLATGGRVGITDVVADPARLPPELTGLLAWVACVADARPLEQYVAILTAAGLRVIRTEPHHAAMTRMIDQIEARLRLVAMTAGAEALGVNLDRAPAVLAAARTAVVDGTLGYALIVAEKPAAATGPRLA